MYFAVIGNHPEITLKELQLIHPKNLEKKSAAPRWATANSRDHLITFDTNEPKQLPNIASLIKRGQVFPTSELGKILWNTSSGFPWQGEGSEAERGLSSKRILGIADKNLGINFKKQYKMKRFKQVDILHTDMEVKNKGIELIKIPWIVPPVQSYGTRGDVTKWQGGYTTEYGVVQGYQNIKLYEVVDFEKPARSMQTGMMPAKLTHTLINIALSYNKNASLIFDPFCWTGTTGFIANALGYNFIGSDIKLNLALTNQPRREQTKYFQDKLFQFTEQDISKPLNPTTFAPLLANNSLIVTEGRLGPVIKQTTTPAEIQEYQRRVKNLYLQFIQTITDFFPKEKKPVMVFTIPIYLIDSPEKGHRSDLSDRGRTLNEVKGTEKGFIEEQISSLASQLWRKMETLDEVYKRENQKVWRKVIILQ